jgi:hypothetical protein
LRKDKTADLQEAFINLAKSVEADPPPELLAAERGRDTTGNFGEVRPRKFEGEGFASVVRVLVLYIATADLRLDAPKIGKVQISHFLKSVFKKLAPRGLQLSLRQCSPLTII